MALKSLLTQEKTQNRRQIRKDHLQTIIEWFQWKTLSDP